MKSLFLILNLFLLPVPMVYSAPQSDLWAYWQNHSDTTNKISHLAWQAILDKNLTVHDYHHLFAYKTIDQSDREKLNTYIETLSQLNPLHYNRNEQYAYWVNLYNSLTVKLVIDAYPVKSIKNVNSFWGFGPWDNKVININNVALSLNDIEHRILRPIWRDPRTHYVLNCASLGCPNLAKEALTGQNLTRLLEQAATDFINSPKGVFIGENKNVRLSSIYQWFEDDFIPLHAHLNKYLKTPLSSSYKAHFNYDWRLNNQTYK